MDTLGNEEVPGTRRGARIRLQDDSWSVRLSQASLGRSALEVYVDDSLVDVVVPTALVSYALRGACSVSGDDRRRVTLAWGTFGVGRETPPEVTFRRGRIFGCRRQVGETSTVGGRFWISAADGRFTEVTITHTDVECDGVERGVVHALRGGAQRRIGER